MKTKEAIITALMIGITSLASCSGDHSSRIGQDTSKQQYDEQGSGVDTSRTTTVTGDAGNIDNSGSGGTRIARDTSNAKITTKADTTNKQHDK